MRSLFLVAIFLLTFLATYSSAFYVDPEDPRYPDSNKYYDETDPRFNQSNAIYTDPGDQRDIPLISINRVKPYLGNIDFYSSDSSVSVEADYYNSKINLRTIGSAITALDWNKLQNYPPACGPGEVVQGVGDTLTCVAIASVMDTNCSNNSSCILTGKVFTGIDSNFLGNLAINGHVDIHDSNTNTALVRILRANQIQMENGTLGGQISSHRIVPDQDNTYPVGASNLRYTEGHFIDMILYNALFVSGTTTMKTLNLDNLNAAFIDLNDVPNSYSGQAGKFVQVNAGATGLQFANSSGGDTNWADINKAIPWQDVNVANNLTINTDKNIITDGNLTVHGYLNVDQNALFSSQILGNTIRSVSPGNNLSIGTTPSNCILFNNALNIVSPCGIGVDLGFPTPPTSFDDLFLNGSLQPQTTSRPAIILQTNQFAFTANSTNNIGVRFNNAASAIDAVVSTGPVFQIAMLQNQGKIGFRPATSFPTVPFDKNFNGSAAIMYGFPDGNYLTYQHCGDCNYLQYEQSAFDLPFRFQTGDFNGQVDFNRGFSVYGEADFNSSVDINSSLIVSADSNFLGSQKVAQNFYVDGNFINANGIDINFNGANNTTYFKIDKNNASFRINGINGGNETTISLLTAAGRVFFPNLITSGSAAQAVHRNATTGELFGFTSSSKYKMDIQDIQTDINLYKYPELRWVVYKDKASGETEVGLIAEEVDLIYPMATLRDEKGEIVGTDYHSIAMIGSAYSMIMDQKIAKMEENIESMTILFCKNNPDPFCDKFKDNQVNPIPG